MCIEVLATVIEDELDFLCTISSNHCHVFAIGNTSTYQIIQLYYLISCRKHVKTATSNDIQNQYFE